MPPRAETGTIRGRSLGRAPFPSCHQVPLGFPSGRNGRRFADVKDIFFGAVTSISSLVDVLLARTV